ncbi:MAG: hypothetical protein ACQEQ4_10750 [Fibrobacterota bacterium]
MKKLVLLLVLAVPLWARSDLAFHQGSENLYLGIHPGFIRYGGLGLSAVYEKGIINNMLSHGGEAKLNLFSFGLGGLYRFNFHPFAIPDAQVGVADKLDLYTGLSTGIWFSNTVSFMFSPMLGTKYYFKPDFGGWFEIDFYGVDLGVVIGL